MTVVLQCSYVPLVGDPLIARCTEQQRARGVSGAANLDSSLRLNVATNMGNRDRGHASQLARSR
jgi:hypothetical protein